MMIRHARSLFDWLLSTGHPASVIRHQKSLETVSDQQLTDQANEIRDRLLEGTSESIVAGKTFALLREAAKRRLGIEHRPNQLTAARHLLKRQIVEMPTGEGKTLAATPALALRALMGRGVWLATANDYLARRDAETMRPLFELLGLTVGAVQGPDSPDQRRKAYACDITYGTIREFGFDFLRDRLRSRRGDQTQSADPPLQRQRYSIIVDEADSILLDDARTPLIISEPFTSAQRETLFRWSVSTGRRLVPDRDYFVDPASTHVWLSDAGRAQIRELAQSDILSHITLPEAYESVAKAVEAEKTFHLNRDFVIRDEKIVIVDRLTGRLAEGRQWQNGIQQSLEAAHGLEITSDTNPVAKVTVQAFLRGFLHLSGMTGTAIEASREFRHSYKMRTVVVGPFRPCQRIELPVQIKNCRQEKWKAVIQVIREMRDLGRPVLIGTRDLNASQELSEQLTSSHIDHQVLTARQEADEAELISRAGQPGIVTVSTSIAGRGTDIRLGPGVADAGGLHVIAADLFDASRIDRQLAGRGGRQGDPATYQKILSLEDEILLSAWDEELCDRKVRGVMLGSPSEKLALLESSQREIERRHTKARRDLFDRDREQSKRHKDLGFDPYLDDVES